MATCVHQIPGRLRARVPGLARSGDRGERLRRHLTELEGVRQVAVNPPADSITVHYDPHRLAPAAILERIAAPGTALQIVVRPAATGPAPLLSESASRLGNLFGKALIDAMLARGVERSVRLLVGGR